MSDPVAVLWTVIHVRTGDNYTVVLAQHIINSNVRSLPWAGGRRRRKSVSVCTKEKTKRKRGCWSSLF